MTESDEREACAFTDWVAGEDAFCDPVMKGGAVVAQTLEAFSEVDLFPDVFGNSIF